MTSKLDKIFELITYMENEFPEGCKGVVCGDCPLYQELGANSDMCNVLRWMIKKENVVKNMKAEHKYPIGYEVMGTLHGVPIAGEILKRTTHGRHGETLMYVINNIDKPNNRGLDILLEEKYLSPYDEFKWIEINKISVVKKIEDKDTFKYPIGCKIMGMWQGTPVAGEIIVRTINGCSTETPVYVINNIDKPDDLASRMLVEEDKMIPFDDIAWKQAVLFCVEANKLIKIVESDRKLALGLLSDKAISIKTDV